MNSLSVALSYSLQVLQFAMPDLTSQLLFWGGDNHQPAFMNFFLNSPSTLNLWHHLRVFWLVSFLSLIECGYLHSFICSFNTHTHTSHVTDFCICFVRSCPAVLRVPPGGGWEINAVLKIQKFTHCIISLAPTTCMLCLSHELNVNIRFKNSP